MAIDPVTALLDIGGKVIDRIWPDPAQAASAKFELFKLQQSGELAQIGGQLQINMEEAKNTNIFVSGWRPFIGWTCGMACAWNWIGLKIALFGCSLWDVYPKLAPADLSEMLPVLLGMLGIGGLRTIEKLRGKS